MDRSRPPFLLREVGVVPRGSRQREKTVSDRSISRPGKLTWVSDKLSDLASSFLSAPTTYCQEKNMKKCDVILNDVFNHLVLLECLLQFEQLAGREGRSDPLWLAEGKKELWEVGACENGERERKRSLLGLAGWLGCG